MLHVGRDQAGKRRLEEIAVLRPRDDGMVTALGAWHVDRGIGSGMVPLRDLLTARGRA